MVYAGHLRAGVEFLEALFQDGLEHRLDFFVLRGLFRVQVDVLVVPVLEAVQRVENVCREGKRFLVDAVVHEVGDECVHDACVLVAENFRDFAGEVLAFDKLQHNRVFDVAPDIGNHVGDAHHAAFERHRDHRL